MTHHLVPASRVEGAGVFAATGERLGKIDDLMIDKVSGGAAYALMSFDGFLGVGDRFYPIPWRMLDYDPSRHGFVVPLTREQIEQGHSVADREIEDEIEWREAVHAYYGVVPYWQPIG